MLALSRGETMYVSRRESLALCGALTMSACTAPRPAGSIATASSLDSLARRTGRRFGSAVAWGPPGADRGSFANPAYAAILERECGLLVPENELKWAWTRPTSTGFDFRQFDAIADYAQAKGFQLRGHTLFWAPEKWYPK